jgi:vacuolar-type H+-ATPase subunit I/STV1
MSDVIDGVVYEDAPELSEASAAEPAPEILVEGGDELRLLDFFAPRLWGAALIPLLFTAVTSTLTAVRVGDAISPFGGGTAYEDLYFQAPSIPLLARHLLPFGLPLTTDTGMGYGLTNVLQSNMLLGLGALLIGALLVAAVTRRTNDAIYAAGPYFVYSLLSILLLSRGGKYFQTATDTFPALLGALLAPLLVGLLAKLIAAAMRNAGWLEADMGYAMESVVLDVGAKPASPETPIDSTYAGEAGFATTLEGSPVTLHHVTQALACPFCGNPKIPHVNPHACGRCHRNIGLALEHPELPCMHCGGALVQGAEFCHHCSKWLHGEPLETLEAGLEVA